MFRSLWTAKTGLEAQQKQVDVITHNLANVGTNGFKKSRVVFHDLLYQTERQAGAFSAQNNQYPTSYQVGVGVTPVATVRSHKQGELLQTSNPLDLGINGDGFFQILLPDGTTGYTRNGNFVKDAQGSIVMVGTGYPLQPQIQIPQGASNLSISPDGTVTASVNGQTQQLGQVQLATFINPNGLDAIGGTILKETQASGAPQVGNPADAGLGLGSLNQSYVEAANVNIVEELVSLIQAQRAYDVNSKAVQTSDQMLQKLGQL